MQTTRGIGFKWRHVAVLVVVRVKSVVIVAAQENIVDIGIHRIIFGNGTQNNALDSIAESVHLGDRRLKNVVGFLLHDQ